VQGDERTFVFDAQGGPLSTLPHECGRARWVRRVAEGLLLSACNEDRFYRRGELVWKQAWVEGAVRRLEGEVGPALRVGAGGAVETLDPASGEISDRFVLDSPADVISTAHGVVLRTNESRVLEARSANGEPRWAWEVPERATVSAHGEVVVHAPK